MDYNYQPHNPTGRYVGFAFVIGLHLLVGYALITGLARHAIETIKKPLEAVVIQEVKLPPPPPPPPPKIIEPPKPQAPKVQAPPPPAFIPKAEVTPPPSTAPAITAVPTPPPEPVVIAPPPPPPAPPAPPAPAGPVNIGVACQTQVKPVIPRKALQEGASGVVRAQITVHGGGVAEVQILSGPRIFHGAVREAMMQYKCSAPDGTTAVQEFDFKVE